MLHVKNKHYFVADVHLGLKGNGVLERERSFVDWLDSISSNVAALYLLGDIFDFWWEYKYVVPKGYVRVLGRLAQLVDDGVEVHFFKGNHDRWTFGYLAQEIGLVVHDAPVVVQVGEAHFCVGHGDGLGPHGVLERMFASRFLQRCFSAIHPRWGMSIGHGWSARNRMKYEKSFIFHEETNPICNFARKCKQPVDYFVFGHLHTPVDIELPNKARLVVLGEWAPDGHYAVFDGDTEQFETI